MDDIRNFLLNREKRNKFDEKMLERNIFVLIVLCILGIYGSFIVGPRQIL